VECALQGHGAPEEILPERVQGRVSANEVLNDSTSVNYGHIALRVDTMTSKEYMMSIDEHGINRSDTGPLEKKY
jgi:hypothetical protein